MTKRARHAVVVLALGLLLGIVMYAGYLLLGMLP